MSQSTAVRLVWVKEGFRAHLESVEVHSTTRCGGMVQWKMKTFSETAELARLAGLAELAEAHRKR